MLKVKQVFDDSEQRFVVEKIRVVLYDRKVVSKYLSHIKILILCLGYWGKSASR